MRNFILKIRATPRQTLFLWSLLLAVFGTGIAFRSLWLANIPGINGDEAWYGAQLRDLPHFTWHTPSGNIVDPFHMLPLALSQFLFPSGFLALRLPSLLSGLLLIGLGWLIFRKSLSPTVALIFALLVAGSPDLIAYSRFGWDASHTGLATLFVMCTAVWAGAQLAARLFGSGHWLDIDLADALHAVLRLGAHLDAPRSAWSATAKRALPGAVGYWTCTVIVFSVLCLTLIPAVTLFSIR